MKKFIYLFLGCFMVFAVSSCGSNQEEMYDGNDNSELEVGTTPDSDEEEVSEDKSPNEEAMDGNYSFTAYFNDEDVVQNVHNGDEIIVYSCVEEVKMLAVATDKNAVMEGLKEPNPQILRHISKEEPAPTELTFHWLNIKQETPNKFIFSIKSEKEDEPKEIFLRFVPIGFASKTIIHFILE